MSDSIPLSLPSILINPKSKTSTAQTAFAAQQREHAEALLRRRRERERDDSGIRVGARNREGKRALRRRENAMMAHNPHVALPTRLDLLPPSPRHTRSFPSPASSSSKSLRSAPAPSPSLPSSDPPSSEAGKYTLSLKGVRTLLRKRGRRAEGLVKIVEGELRGWSGCELDDGEVERLNAMRDTREVDGYGRARVVDETLVPVKQSSAAGKRSGVVEAVNPGDQAEHLVGATARALPRPFTTNPNSSVIQLSNLLTSIYSSSHMRDPSSTNLLTATPIHTILTPSQEETPEVDWSTERQAIIELVRAPGHLVWAVEDGWERLIVHLLARYYGLISFSQTLPPIPYEKNPAGEHRYSPAYRITHILHPTSLHPPAIPSGNSLLTPENSEIDTDLERRVSGSGSESEGGFGSTSESDVVAERVGLSESESEAETERGGESDVEVEGAEGQRIGDSTLRDELDGVETDSESNFEGDTTLQPPELSSTTSTTATTSILTPVGRAPPTNIRRKPRDSLGLGNRPNRPSNGNRLTSGDWARQALSEDGDGDDDGDDSAGGEASDEEGYAASTSSLLDSLILDAPAHITGRERPEPIEGVEGPFESQFDVPLELGVGVDLFPERRRGLGGMGGEAGGGGDGRLGGGKRGKMSFFEYLYG